MGRPSYEELQRQRDEALAELENLRRAPQPPPGNTRNGTLRLPFPPLAADTPLPTVRRIDVPLHHERRRKLHAILDALQERGEHVQCHRGRTEADQMLVRTLQHVMMWIIDQVELGG